MRFSVPGYQCCLGAVLLALAGCAGPATSLPEGDITLIETNQRADTAYQQGRYGEAAALYETLTEALPNDAGYWYRLGNAYVRAERPREGALAYERSLSIDGNNPRAWHNLGIILLRQAQEAFIRGTHTATPDAPERAQNQRMADLLMQLTGQEQPVPTEDPRLETDRTESAGSEAE